MGLGWVFLVMKVGDMIRWCSPFGLIQKDQKIKTLAAGPDLRYGPLENLQTRSFVAQTANFPFRVPSLRSETAHRLRSAFFFFPHPIGHCPLIVNGFSETTTDH